MESLKVSVKWGKQRYDNVDVDLAQNPLVFKAQLFSLTGVQPDRQKVVLRGKTLRDDSWDGFPIQNGSLLLLLGSTGDIPQAPATKTVFMEDMSAADVNKAMDLVLGLKNLGNTCYLNATLQCLFTVPELVMALKKFKASSRVTMSREFTLLIALKEQFYLMSKTEAEYCVPKLLLGVLHVTFPQFSTKDEHDAMEQQDANELWVLLLRCADQFLPGSLLDLGDKSPSVVSAFFSGTFNITMRCTELVGDSAVEEVETSEEQFFQLSCFLSTDVKHLINGLRAKMTETITKRSKCLDRDAKFERTSVITRLPKYLTIQLVRFFYKERDNVNAKILKDVKFPIELDVYDLCSAELQNKLKPMRDVIKQIEDDNISKALVADSQDDKKMPNKVLPTAFEDDVGSNNSGRYTLRAVLTHKGRSSNSGHYVAWIRGKRKGQWLKCDDEEVTIVTEEEILRLSGGGDWHCAYVLLYGPKVVETVQAEPMEVESVGTQEAK